MLIPAHAELLRASAVSAEVVEARGYYSAIGTKAELGRLGFSPAQRRIPGLLIPVWDVDGVCVGHQLRPDEPREVKGKAVKYETARDARQVLDVNPLAQPKLDDPAIPIVVTEGVRKADSAVSRGLLAIGLNGVWGWVGTNARGGKAALIDWRSIPLNGRLVLLAFDNDVLTKAQVNQALEQLSAFLARRKATVRIVLLPDDPGGAKVGLDDWFSANPDAGFAELVALAVDELPSVQPAADTFDDVDEEHGWVVLEEVRDLLVKYVWFPSDGLADAVALWIAHCHQLDVIDFTARLHIRSAMKRSGKSRLLEVIKLLVPRPMLTLLVTPAVLYRSIEAIRPTVLLDEVDRQLRRDAMNADDAVIAVLNGGYERSGTVHRNVGTTADMTVKEFPVFAAVAMAGIGLIADTVADRSVTIRLERRPSSRSVTDFRSREARTTTRELARRLTAWSARHADGIGAARPVSPKGLNDRQADIWEPLLAIADAAGGSWPERARVIAVALSKVADAEDIDSTMELQLLADIHETWPANIDRRFSAEIVQALNMLDGRPWSDFNHVTGITTNQLAGKLKDFGIRSKQLRIGSETKKGYEWIVFVDVWERYGVVEPTTSPDSPLESETSETSETDQVGATRDVSDVSDVSASAGLRGHVDASPNGDVPTSGVQKIPRKARR